MLRKELSLLHLLQEVADGQDHQVLGYSQLLHQLFHLLLCGLKLQEYFEQCCLEMVSINRAEGDF